MLEIHEKYHQIFKYQVRQEEDEVLFDWLDEQLYILKRKAHNWWKQEEKSFEKNSPFGKKSHSIRSSNSSTKKNLAAKINQVGKLNAEASYVERKHATEHETEAFRIQELVVRAKAREKVFESMD